MKEKIKRRRNYGEGNKGEDEEEEWGGRAK
jgi:hypothetical protein